MTRPVSGVDDETETLLDKAQISGHRDGDGHDLGPDQAIADVSGRGNMLPGKDQEMDRSLGRDIPDDEDVIVFVKHLGREPAFDDLTENAGPQRIGSFPPAVGLCYFILRRLGTQQNGPRLERPSPDGPLRACEARKRPRPARRDDGAGAEEG